MWRLVLTTGFVGTGLFALFMLGVFLRHVRRRDPISVLGCMCLLMSGVFMIVYDSLESPLFILMLAVGLMHRSETTAHEKSATDPHLAATPRSISRETS